MPLSGITHGCRRRRALPPCLVRAPVSTLPRSTAALPFAPEPPAVRPHYSCSHPLMSDHDIHDFIASTSAGIASEYRRIQKRAKEDPGTAGDQGEENWRELLEGWLPSGYSVVTKGRIIGFDGTTSPQMDVIVLRPSYPPSLRGKKHYLVGGVAAAFECKLTLTAQHVYQSIDASVKIRRLLHPRQGDPYRELTSSVVTGLLAHSHSWKSDKSQPVENIERAIREADAEYVDHPREMLDLICVADLGGWATGRVAKGFTTARWVNDKGESGLTEVGSRVTLTSYNQMFAVEGSKNSPLGMFIVRLIRKIAYEDQSMRPIARDFGHIGFPGQGISMIGPLVRTWPDSVMTDESHREMEVKFGPAALNGGDSKLWNPWMGTYW